MSNMLTNKNMVVMGVANKWSIAWGIAKGFHGAGANLVFTYYGERSLKSLNKLLEEEGISDAVLVSCDVTSDEDLENAFKIIKEEVHIVHGVVHSIAHAKKEELAGEYKDTSRDGFLMAQNISAYSLVAVAKQVEPLMTEGGCITTLTYLGGERVVKNYNVMGVAKASLEASVKYLAHDMGQKSIRVNAISAGPIKTLAARGVSGFELLQKNFEEKAPFRRMVTHVEIANTAIFLNSDMGTGVTGENIHVDCGYHILGY